MKKFKDLSGQIPFWHFDDSEDLMVFADGSLGGAFQIQGYDINCKSEDEINNFNRAIENLLVSAEEGLRLQVFYKLTSNVDRLLEKHKEIAASAPEVYGPVAKARHGHFDILAHDQASFFVPELYLFIRSKAHGYKKRKIFDKKELFESIGKEDYKSHQSKFLRSLKQIEASLSHAGLNPKSLSKSQWFDLCFEYLNFDRVMKFGSTNLKSNDDLFAPSIVDQLTLTDLEVERDSLKIGDLYFKAITLKTPPEGFTYSAMVDEFTKLPFHFWLSQNIEILSQSKEQESLQLKRRVAFAMASGSQNVSDIESESKLEDIEGLLRELVEGSERLVKADFTVIIWAKNKEELADKTDDVLKAFRDMNQAEGVSETLPCFDVFMNSLPGVCTGLRHLKLKSSNTAHLMPLYAPWSGGNRPVCLIPTRENALFSYDPFAKHLPNWNGLIFGGSGSGKSFTIAQLMLMFYGQENTPKIVWIDNGASSKRLLEVLDGEFVDLNLNSGLCINVFDTKVGEEVTSEKIKLILAVLELILKDDERKGLPKREKALLEQAIYQTYEYSKGEVPTLSSLKQILDQHSDIEMRKFGEILFSWTGKTAYGKMLDGKTNINLTKDLVTIEVQGLTNHPEIKDIFLLLLTSFFQEEAAGDLARPYLLIVDEAERLFKTEMAKQFVITCYRTWRKYNAGIYSISQNYRDFLAEDEIRDALMPNTTSVFILRQKKIDWKHFKEIFDFNDAQVDAIKSLEVVKGKHSELFLLQDEDQAILKLVPEPLSYWICTSDGNDKAQIAEIEEKYPELKKIEVLETLAFPERFKKAS
jgi:conjugal transfer ATP-binding protein TraC